MAGHPYQANVVETKINLGRYKTSLAIFKLQVEKSEFQFPG